MYCLYNIDPHLQASGIFCNKNIFNTDVTINKNVLSASLNKLNVFFQVAISVEISLTNEENAQTNINGNGYPVE